MNRVDTRPRKRNSPRPAEKSAPGYLQWLRGRRCALSDSGVCMGRIEAAHVDHGGDKGMGTKVSDRFAIPLCSRHHERQHSWGWITFQAAFQFDALDAAAVYWQRWPSRLAWEKAHPTVCPSRGVP